MASEQILQWLDTLVRAPDNHLASQEIMDAESKIIHAFRELEQQLAQARQDIETLKAGREEWMAMPRDAEALATRVIIVRQANDVLKEKNAALEAENAQARDMFERLLRWFREGRFTSMENQHLQIHWLNEIRAFLADHPAP